MNLTSFLMLIAVAFPAPEKLRAQNRDRLKTGIFMHSYI